MKKTIFALLLVVALVAVLAIPAAAEGEYNPYHCICGAQQYESAEATTPKASATCQEGCDGVNHTWTPWNGKGGVFMDGPYYFYLDKNWASNELSSAPAGEGAVFGKTMVVNASRNSTTNTDDNRTPDQDVYFHFDLNGHTVTSDSRFIRMDGATGFKTQVTISDTSAGGTGKICVTGTYGNNGMIVWANSSAVNSSLTVFGGTYDVAGFKSGSNAIKGGAFCNNAQTTFDIYNAAIYGSEKTTKDNQGAAIYVNGGTVRLHDCTVYSGKNSQGGCVFVGGSGRFEATDTVFDGRNTTNQYGGCICVYSNNSVAELTDCTIYGGTVNGSGGACVSIPQGKVIANNCSMIGGSHTGTNATNGAFGGAMMNLAGTFEMNGGSMTGGVPSSDGRGGAINLRPGATFTVSGDAKIYGCSGNNVYQQGTGRITIGDDGLGANACIGVTLTGTDAAVPAAAVDSFFCDNADYTLNAEGKAQAVNAFEVDGENVNWTAAKAADSAKLVQDLRAQIILDENFVLDMNGHDVSVVQIAEGKTLNVFDSATADYTSDDYGVIKNVFGKGTLASSFVNADKQRYLTLKDENGYSFHRFYLAVTHITLKDGTDAGFKTSFKCNDKVMAAINNGGEYGIQLQINDGEKNSYSFNKAVEKTNVNTVVTMGITAQNAADYLAAAQKVNAYIKIGETTVTSAVKETSVKELVLGILGSKWDGYDEAQKAGLKTLYTNHSAILDSWNNDLINKLK